MATVKLTIELDEDLARLTESHARDLGTTLSDYVARRLRDSVPEPLPKPECGGPAQEEGDRSWLEELPPGVRRLVGIIPNPNASVEDYREYLEEKYLKGKAQ